MAYEPLYFPQHTTRHGLSVDEWDVAIDKCKTPFGRRVIVYVRHRASGRVANDSVVGDRLTKRDLDTHAARLIEKLVKSLTSLGPEIESTATKLRHQQLENGSPVVWGCIA